MATTYDPNDSIDKRITIQADAERVYALVSRPGWWISDDILSTEGDVSHVGHQKYGTFRIRTVEARPPRYVSFRWMGGDQANEALTASPGTLIEFWIEELEGGGVSLRVVESGFSALPISEERRRKNIEENTTGWEEELAKAKALAEAA